MYSDDITHSDISPSGRDQVSSSKVQNVACFHIFLAIGFVSFDIFKQIFHGTDKDDQEQRS